MIPLPVRWDYPPLDINPVFSGLAEIIINFIIIIIIIIIVLLFVLPSIILQMYVLMFYTPLLSFLCHRLKIHNHILGI